MRHLFDLFAVSSRRYPANTAMEKADTVKHRQNRSTSPFASGASDTRTDRRRYDTGWTRNGLQRPDGAPSSARRPNGSASLATVLLRLLILSHQSATGRIASVRPRRSRRNPPYLSLTPFSQSAHALHRASPRRYAAQRRKRFGGRSLPATGLPDACPDCRVTGSR